MSTDDSGSDRVPARTPRSRYSNLAEIGDMCVCFVVWAVLLCLLLRRMFC